MARVVQQRSGPPYLLIVFVFLFLVSTALAVLFYTRYDETFEKKAEADRTIEAMASSAQLKWQRIAKIRTDYRRSRTKDAPTVVGQLSADIDQLTDRITGKATDPNDALAKIDALNQEGGENSVSLVEMIRGLRSNVADQSARIEELRGENTKKQQEVTDLNKTVESVRSGLSEEISNLKGRIRQLDTQLAAEHKARQDRLNALESQYEETMAKLRKELTEKVGQIERLQLNVARPEQRVVELEREIKVGRGPQLAAEIRPDGEVMKVLDESDICYINLGSADRIQPGVSFAVYRPGAALRQGEEKARIIVSDVMDSISACRIVKDIKTDPITIGDLISNVAFDRIRMYKFLVEGEFDLHGTGDVTAEGTQTVKELISRFGGKVTEELSPVDTDFVVLGQEPVRPVRPGEDAPPSDWKIYGDNLKIYEHYQQVKLTAQKLNIPILNTNKFLDLTGYTPPRVLK